MLKLKIQTYTLWKSLTMCPPAQIEAGKHIDDPGAGGTRVGGGEVPLRGPRVHLDRHPHLPTSLPPLLVGLAGGTAAGCKVQTRTPLRHPTIKSQSFSYHS